MFLRKDVPPTSPKHVHRCGAQHPVALPSKLSIPRVSQSHMRLKATMEMRDREARVDGTAQVRGSTLGIEDHNRRYKRGGELGHVRIYVSIIRSVKKLPHEVENAPPHGEDENDLDHNSKPDQNTVKRDVVINDS